MSRTQIGDGTTINKTLPVVIDGSTPYSSISMWQWSTLGITAAGVLKSWGYNNFGQLGDTTFTDKTSPVVVNAGTSFSKVLINGSTTCALVAVTNVLKCWGQNSVGEVGNGMAVIHVSTPTVIDGGTPYLSMAPWYNSAGVTTAGVLKGWGENTYGQVGNNTTSIAYAPLVSDPGFTYTSVQTGANVACGLTTAGVLKCWGKNDQSTTGDGSDIYRNLPRSIRAWLNP